MVSTEIIKNWGGGQNGGEGQKIILGGAFAPPGAATAASKGENGDDREKGKRPRSVLGEGSV